MLNTSHTLQHMPQPRKPYPQPKAAERATILPR